MTTLTTIARTIRPHLGKPGMQTMRACNIRDVLLCVRESAKAKRRVRVYSCAGFVPNSYKWRCQIQYIEGNKTDDGWQYHAGWTGAQRSGGAGTLIVIQ